MAATDARPVPRKNAAYRFYFAIRKPSDSTLITTWTGADSEVSLDGAAYSDCTNEATEIGTTGTGYIDLTSSEMNADCVILKVTVTNSGAVPLVFTLFPEEVGDYRCNVEQFGGSNGTFSGGRPEVNTTHAAGTAWGSGAITAASIASDAITAAKIADNAIDAGAIASDAITAAKIASDAISAAKIATGAITAAKFAAGAIDAAAIANGAIDAATFAADVDAEILSYIVDDATRIDASALNTLSSHDPGEAIMGATDLGTGAGLTTLATQANVDTIVAKLPSKAFLTGTEAEAGNIELDEANGLPTVIESIADEVQTRTIAAVTTVSSVSGSVGSVTGNVGGNVVGNVNGDLVGSVLGNVAGDVQGNVDGKVLGTGAGTITGTGVRAVDSSGNAIAPSSATTTIASYLDTEVAAILAAVDTEVAAIKAKTDQLTFTVANKVDATATVDVDEEAIADAVWDEAIAGHLTAGTTGAKLNSAASAGDPWATPVPGSYAAGTAGAKIGKIGTPNAIYPSDNPNVEDPMFTLIAGDTYSTDLGNAKRRQSPAGATFPDPTGRTISMGIGRLDSEPDLVVVEGTLVSWTDGVVTADFPFTAEETATLDPDTDQGKYGCSWGVAYAAGFRTAEVGEIQSVREWVNE